MTSGTPTMSELSLVEGLWAAGITFITGVPDSEFRSLIAELERTTLNERYVLATREDNALAIAAGAYLGGEQPLVFMESSGIGNAIDALTSLVIVSELPLVLFVAWAGYGGRDVPHHNVIGEPLEALFEALGVPTLAVGMQDGAAQMCATIGAALDQAQARRGPVAVLGIPEKLRKGLTA